MSTKNRSSSKNAITTFTYYDFSKYLICRVDGVILNRGFYEGFMKRGFFADEYVYEFNTL